jgi:hypothetical protein
MDNPACATLSTSSSVLFFFDISPNPIKAFSNTEHRICNIQQHSRKK